MGPIREETSESQNARDHPFDDDVEISQPEQARLHSVSQDLESFIPPSGAPHVHLLSADTISVAPSPSTVDIHKVDLDVVTGQVRSAPTAHRLTTDPPAVLSRRVARRPPSVEEDLALDLPSLFGATGQDQLSADPHVAAQPPRHAHAIHSRS